MGLMRNIVILEYNSEWPAKFEVEEKRLSDALSSTLEAVHHIGSTSVPGLAAKPTIDILVVVHCLSELDDCNKSMMNLGYVPKGEFGIPGRRFYSKGSDDNRTHHVHAFELGHPEVNAHLDFRDYLRVHQGHAAGYANLKVSLAQRYRNDIGAYIDGKTPLIKQILDNALKWRQASHRST